jgi:hypothetical protein
MFLSPGVFNFIEFTNPNRIWSRSQVAGGIMQGGAGKPGCGSDSIHTMVFVRCARGKNHTAEATAAGCRVYCRGCASNCFAFPEGGTLEIKHIPVAEHFFCCFTAMPFVRGCEEFVDNMAADLPAEKAN